MFQILQFTDESLNNPSTVVWIISYSKLNIKQQMSSEIRTPLKSSETGKVAYYITAEDIVDTYGLGLKYR